MTKKIMMILCTLCLASQSCLYALASHADSLENVTADSKERPGEIGENFGAADTETLPGTGETSGAADTETQPGTGETSGAADTETLPGAGETSGAADTEAQPGTGETSEAADTETQPGTGETSGAADTETQPGTGETSGAADTETQPGAGETSGAADTETLPGGGGTSGANGTETIPAEVESQTAAQIEPPPGITIPDETKAVERPEDVVSIQVPDNIDFSLDPFGLKKGKQIYSNKYAFRNTGEKAILLRLMDIYCSIDSDVWLAGEGESDEEIRESDDKVIRLLLSFESGDSVLVTEEGSDYEVVLEAGELLHFWIGGCMSENIENEWEDGEISIEMIFGAEVSV